jgi:hypothetical protein
MSMRSKPNRRVSLRKLRCVVGGVTVAVTAVGLVLGIVGGVTVVASAVGKFLTAAKTEALGLGSGAFLCQQFPWLEYDCFSEGLAYGCPRANLRSHGADAGTFYSSRGAFGTCATFSFFWSLNSFCPFGPFGTLGAFTTFGSFASFDPFGHFGIGALNNVESYSRRRVTPRAHGSI